MNGAASNSSSDAPENGQGEARPEPQHTRGGRSSRIVGLLAAVGFSLAMWAFIALAVLGVILKVAG